MSGSWLSKGWLGGDVHNARGFTGENSRQSRDSEEPGRCLGLLQRPIQGRIWTRSGKGLCSQIGHWAPELPLLALVELHFPVIVPKLQKCLKQ